MKIQKDHFLLTFQLPALTSSLVCVSPLVFILITFSPLTYTVKNMTPEAHYSEALSYTLYFTDFYLTSLNFRNILHSKVAFHWQFLLP